MKDSMVYICAQQLLPHGTPGANRILANAKAIQNAGMPVTIIGHGKENGCTECFFEGIRHLLIPKSNGNRIRKAYHHIYADSRKTIDLINKDGYDKKAVVLYEPYYYFGKKMADFCKRNEIPFCSDSVEWHQPIQYKYGKYDPIYILFVKSFKKIMPASGKVIVISEFLKQHFEKSGCDTVTVPPLVDCSEIVFLPSNNTDGKIRLIYTGTYAHRDNADMMIRSISELTAEEKSRIEFHMTSKNPETIKEICEKCSVDDGIVTVHGFMSYDELISLYSKMDFLFLLREENLITQANFPSKVPEMLACGISVLGSRVGDYHTFLTDSEDSILIDKVDIEAVKSALRRALAMNREEVEKMKKMARATAEAKFDYHNYSHKLKEFIENL